MAVGVDAFPQLIESSEDKRFCCLVKGGAVDAQCLSVGAVCQEIMYSQVVVYDYETEGKLSWTPPTLFPDRYDPHGTKKRLMKWWCDNRGKSLFEIQLAEGEHAIKATKKESPGVDFPKALRARNIKHLEAFVAELKASKKAKPANPEFVIFEMKGKEGREIRLYNGK